MPISKWVDQKLWYIYTMEYYTEKGRRELLSFATAWMELENIMLNDKPVSDWIKNCDTFTQWNSTQQKEEGTSTLSSSMDGTGEHYAKWNKPDGERQIKYDLTYKWNLINKINKQAKYNPKHWNKEQIDSNQRGGGRRIVGEIRGRAIKEHV